MNAPIRDNPRDVAHKNAQRASAELHYVEAAQGYELVLTWNDRLAESQLRRGPQAAAEVRAIAEEKRADLEARGWRRAEDAGTCQAAEPGLV